MWYCDTQCSENVPCSAFLTPGILLCPVFPVILMQEQCVWFYQWEPPGTCWNTDHELWKFILAGFFKKLFSFIPANSLAMGRFKDPMNVKAEFVLRPLEPATAFADACPVVPVGFDALTLWFSARRGWGRWFGAQVLMEWCFLGMCILENQTVLTNSFIGSPSPFCARPCCLLATCLSLRSQELCVSFRVLCMHSTVEGSVRRYLIAQQSTELRCLVLFVWLGKGSVW